LTKNGISSLTSLGLCAIVARAQHVHARQVAHLLFSAMAHDRIPELGAGHGNEAVDEPEIGQKVHSEVFLEEGAAQVLGFALQERLQRCNAYYQNLHRRN
jgi:hypothetical protein